MQTVEARRWVLDGQVQGVGFRPFVYRLAHELGLNGWVINRAGWVEIHTEGTNGVQKAFAQALIEQAPPLARPRLLKMETVPLNSFKHFTIRDSEQQGDREIHLPADYFTCNDCLKELTNPANRRYHYPFINCTQCGPRYTLITALPYDRANTSMAIFPLCPECQKEYEDPLDRRFHAEPIACPSCGPQLLFEDGESEARHTDNDAALHAAVSALQSGGIIAVKGIGGYHLMCDARNDAAILRLRKHKPRPHKPLAVMFPAPAANPLQQLLGEVDPGAEERAQLLSPIRPIVLITRKTNSTLSPQIAPGLNEVGVMLPYSPLHHLLLDRFGGPLVATSGNISGEPVITENETAQRRLAPVTSAFLHHNRPIIRPADDPLFRRIHNRIRPLRLGRGCTPLELSLPFRLSRPCLAVGGHMKNSIALGWNERVIISPHIGDMGAARSIRIFEQVVTDLQSLYSVQAETVLCDAHPGYAPSQWARRCGLPLQQIFHHTAHASALVGEHETRQDWLVFTWDGVGLGEDGTLWGGEALSGRPGAWQRVATLRPFHLPGGDKAAREPWRSALAICWEIDRQWKPAGRNRQDLELLQHAWQRRLNSPQTSAVGRLFDATAALAGICQTASFEGQGPMWLEASCREKADPVELPLQRDENGLWRSDWQPLVEALLDAGWSPAEQAARVHATLAQALVQQAIQIRQQQPVECIGLCGGVFQNRILCEQAITRLEANGFKVYLNEQVPMNDGGLSFGQIIEFGARR